VTRFKCGGVALGLRVHHHVIDGAAFSYFVTSWAEISRGQQISVPPTLDRSAMKARNPPTPQFEHIEYSIINIDPASLYPAGGFPAMAAATFDFSSKDVKCLKTQAELSTEDGISFTGFEILAGHLWRSIAKARGIDPSKDLKFGLAVDGRSRFNPPVPNGYFGNVNFYGSAQSNAGELLSKPLSHAARCVHAAITRMTDKYLRSALDFVEVQESPLYVQPSFKCFLGSDLAISSWIWFPCYDVDYGWGKPVFFGVPVSAFDGLVILLPSPEGNGAVKVLIGLRTDHLRSLQADPQFHPV
jgi:shikimate O-hydroxycinnamoyltransferase